MKLFKTIHLRRALGILSGGLVIYCLLAIGSVVRQVSYHTLARAEVRALFGRIALGDSKAQVRRTFASGGYKELKLHAASATSNRWIFQTPTEFGAGNWVFYVEFDSKSEVVALRVRTNDSPHEKPNEPFPADEVAPDWTTPFP